MRVEEFDYQLPADRIAVRPPAVRGQAKLLVLDKTSGEIADRKYQDLADIVQPGDVVILNNTKVIKARIIAKLADGRVRELILIEQHGKSDDWHTHRVLYRGKLRVGDWLAVGQNKVEVVAIEDGGVAQVRSKNDLLELAQKYGEVPLPPYIKREATSQDVARYQTEFAQATGSVAAPTASLNMTKELLARLASKGVIVCELTLHVGLGTFLPIRSDSLSGHNMHSEWYEIPKPTITKIQKAKADGRRVVALGTTVARTLEFAAKQILYGQPTDLSGEADIFIYPGYKFQVVDVLLTNFHAPRSTVLMLAAAFAGRGNLLNAYQYALSHDYKFLSYGDSMLIL